MKEQAASFISPNPPCSASFISPNPPCSAALLTTMPHFVIVPLMAQGHMIPALDMARLLADRGATVSFITTPVNAARIRPIINRIQNSNLPIRFIQLPFPSSQAGLPAGCENFDLITSDHILKQFIQAFPLLSPLLQNYLLHSSTTPKPDCIISDSIYYWTVDVARNLGIPRLAFHGPSCFYMYCSMLLRKTRFLDEIEDDFEMFELPDMPVKIEMIKAQARSLIDSAAFADFRDKFEAAAEGTEGIVLNTFYDLEHFFIHNCEKATGKKIWTIGPLSENNKDIEDRENRGNPSSIDSAVLLQWLNQRSRNSVILLSFGSISRHSFLQLKEIAHALEASRIPFIWVLKELGSSAIDTWMSNFEERTRSTGLLIRGWAPQSVILSHEAVGGFVTHCGWNSTIEAIAAGVPMATWPRFGDQFYNERLVVDVLRVGVAVGVKSAAAKVVAAAEEEKEEWVIGRDDVKEAVRKLMGGGEEAEERRNRVREFADMAKKAMEEGGSSKNSLDQLISFVGTPAFS